MPSFEHDDVTAYAKSEDEIREWILDGKPRRLREAADGEAEPVLRMPAWSGRLSPGEVEASSSRTSRPSPTSTPCPTRSRTGGTWPRSSGCFTCHGPQGRFDTPNPGSLKGYIPSWSGADFPELARDAGEIREWIRDGSPKRLRDHPVAAFFMRRQAIRMPAYGDRVSEDDVRRITAYIGWLQGEAAAPGR